MALRAMQLDAAGAVVDGNIRDLEEHRGLRFPVKKHHSAVSQVFEPLYD